MAEARNYEEYRKQVLEELGIEYVTEDITDFRRWKKKLLNGLANLITKGDMTEPVAKWLDAHPEVVAKDYITPEMFGAVGDGSTDDSGAIQSALNKGVPVMLSKQYVITGVAIPSNSYIFGFGELIQKTGATVALQANNANDILIEGITLTSITGSFEAESDGAFKFTNCNNVIIHDVICHLVTDRNIVFKTCTNCQVYNATGHGDGTLLTIYNSDYSGVHDAVIHAIGEQFAHSFDVYASSYISKGCYAYNITGYKCGLNLLQMSAYGQNCDIIDYDIHDLRLIEGHCVAKLRGLSLAKFEKCHAEDCEYAFSVVDTSIANVCDIIINNCEVINGANNYIIIGADNQVRNLSIKNSVFINTPYITSGTCLGTLEIVNNQFYTDSELRLSSGSSQANNIIFKNNTIKGNSTYIAYPQGALDTYIFQNNNIISNVNTGTLINFKVGKQFIFNGNVFQIVRLPSRFRVTIPSGSDSESILVFHYGNLINGERATVGGETSPFTEITYVVA